MEVRNYLFDHHILAAYKAPVPVICVGNLSAGGTGKTPHVEYLVQHLSQTQKVAVLSRGYKRSTTGFQAIERDSLAQKVGDEPLQIFLKFADRIYSAVCESRKEGIKRLIAAHPDITVILLDDAFQHRWVQASLNIVLTDYQNPFFADQLLPMGRLREPRYRIRRADVVIVSKCPSNLDPGLRRQFVGKIVRYFRKRSPIFFTGVRHGAPVPILPRQSQTLPGNNVTLITGIAYPGMLKDHIGTQFNLVSHLSLDDHYRYTAASLGVLLGETSKPDGHFFATTEKDMVKWISPQLSEKLEGKPVYYIPYEIKFIDREHAFWQIINQVIGQPHE